MSANKDRLAEALLPCPFCGGEASMGTIRYSSATVIEQNWGQDTFHKVNCIVCGANNLGLVGFRTEADASKNWNRRTAHDARRTEPLARFGHHPDPAIDFCVEVEAIAGELENHRGGFTNGTPSKEELDRRTERALAFNVGADGNAVTAKMFLRRIVEGQRAESGADMADKERFIRDASKELKWIAERYDDSKSTGECAADAYDMSCTARRVLAHHAQIVLLAAAPEKDQREQAQP